MKINIKGYIYHKEKENYAGCHDRYAYNLDNFSFAIADGVSRSFFPDIWAEILVNGFVNIENKKEFTNKLKTYRQDWFNNVKEQVDKPNQKWFVKNKFYNQDPAAATFVGLSFNKKPDNSYYWEAQALGDSFLFFIPKSEKQIKKNLSNIISLSSKKDFEFDNFPDYFVSKNLNNKGEIKHKESALQVGTFYLLTDALSEWFIKNTNEAQAEINTWKSQETFVNAVIRLRKDNKLENDDSAILIIEIEDDNSNELSINKENQVADINELIKLEKEKKEKPDKPKQETSSNVQTSSKNDNKEDSFGKNKLEDTPVKEIGNQENDRNKDISSSDSNTSDKNRLANADSKNGEKEESEDLINATQTDSPATFKSENKGQKKNFSKLIIAIKKLISKKTNLLLA